jgi:HPt (histidine-containing phosphotransfer) domain-containing protein
MTSIVLDADGVVEAIDGEGALALELRLLVGRRIVDVIGHHDRWASPLPSVREPGQTQPLSCLNPARLNELEASLDEFQCLDICMSFIYDLELLMERLASAHDRRKKGAVDPLLHAIKGCAANIGAERLASRSSLLRSRNEKQGISKKELLALQHELELAVEAMLRHIGLSPVAVEPCDAVAIRQAS